MTVVLVLLGFLLFAGTGVGLVLYGGHRSLNELNLKLESLGYARVLDRSDLAEVARQLAVVHPSQTGKRVVAQLWSRSAADGSRVFLGKVCFAGPRGGMGASPWLFAGIGSPRLTLPRFSLQCRPQQPGLARMVAVLSAQFPIPGLVETPTGDEAFDRRFLLYATPGSGARGVPLEALRGMFQADAPVGLDAGAGILFVSRPVPAGGSGQTPALLHGLAQLAQGIHARLASMPTG